MALNKADYLYDLLQDKFGNKKDYYRMNRIEKEYLKTITIKMNVKSLQRIADIKRRIKKDLNKNAEKSK